MASSNIDPVIVGRVLANTRIGMGITQEAASEAAGIGRSHLSAIENGVRKPTMATFYRICLALGVPMSTVLQEVETLM
ncbi:MAG: helix-turn-helix transcriptional regulator [Clostridia bacterium]|nr:helix-turn-helix transcriptional regulator [Clostridia bacterium]